MNEHFTKLASQFPGTIEVLPVFRDECAWKVPPEKLIELCISLKNHQDVPFEVMVDITAVDQTPKDGTIEVVYHLYSHKIHSFLRVKTSTPSAEPVVPTVSHLWKSAEWMEREVYDLFGVKFSGHPDLRRLLMPDDYDGYPLLKEHPLCPQGDCNDF